MPSFCEGLSYVRCAMRRPVCDSEGGGGNRTDEGSYGRSLQMLTVIYPEIERPRAWDKLRDFRE